MNRIIGVLFAIACISTSWTSGNLLGVGMWFYIILGTGIGVAASQFVPALERLGAGFASVLAVISVIAALLILLLATTGGSFKLDDSEILLLLSFFMIAVFGFSLARVTKKPGSMDDHPDDQS